LRENKIHSAADILKNLIKTTPLGKVFEQAQIWDNWTEVAGKVLAEHGQPKDVRDQRLRVVVDSAVWMHKYSYCKWEIIRRINRMAGKELISDLFFLLADDAEEE